MDDIAVLHMTNTICDHRCDLLLEGLAAKEFRLSKACNPKHMRSACDIDPDHVLYKTRLESILSIHFVAWLCWSKFRVAESLTSHMQYSDSEEAPCRLL